VSLRKLFSVIVMLLTALVLVSALFFITPQGEQYEFILSEPPADGCTVVMVGKDASADSSTMTTHEQIMSLVLCVKSTTYRRSRHGRPRLV